MDQDNESEMRLQGQCFQWHWNTFPAERKRLFMIHNTPRNAIDGMLQKAGGMVAGVADLQYLRTDRPPLFIEMKLPGKKQSKDQIEWEKIAIETGADYIVCSSFEEFKTIITSQW